MLTRTSGTLTLEVSYPRIVASQRDPPPQYPFEDEDWDDEDELD